MMRLPAFVVTGLQVLALLAASAAVYLHALDAPYVLDDVAAIERNESIRDLRNVTAVLRPPAERGVTVGGRPVLNLSFALNRALLGHRPGAYRVVNVAIHAGCVLLAFGLLRRLQGHLGPRRAEALPSSRANLGGGPGFLPPFGLPFCVALLWAMHPLNTSAVTYLSQRAESLASCFYLLTGYAFLRSQAADRLAGAPGRLTPFGGAEGAGSASETLRWRVISVVACFLGVATKEIVVTAPVAILLLDRWCQGESFRAIWGRRRGFYLALGASWLLAAVLTLGTDARGGTIGFGTPVSPAAYLGTQVYGIVHYLQLAVWPTPRVFDYGSLVIPWRNLALPGLVLAVLGVVLAISARKRLPLALAGGLFLLLLAPTTSVVPIASQTLAEHRLYLPLLVLTAGAGFGLARIVRTPVAVAALIAASGGLGFLTWSSNATLRDEVALWRQTLQHRPENARGWSNLGVALARAQRVPEAITALERATALQPDFAEAQNNLGYLFLQLGRPADALPHLEQAVRLRPAATDILGTQAAALARVGRPDEARAVYQRALALRPGDPELLFGLANVELQQGEVGPAVAHYERLLEAEPGRTDARYNLGLARRLAGRTAEAVRDFETVLTSDPGHPLARLELAGLLHQLGRREEAAEHYRVLLRVEPHSAAARAGLERIDRQTAPSPP